MMKVNYVRIVIVLAMNFMFTYLMFGPLGWDKYIQSPFIKEWAPFVIIGSAISLVLTLLFYKFVDKKSIKDLGFRFKKKDVLFSLTIFIENRITY